MEINIDQVVNRYVAVWSEPDPEVRRRAIEGLWADDGVELVESARFRGHEELDARIAAAYKQFVESGRFNVTSADDAFGHHDAVTFTIRLTTMDGEVAWAARVFLIFGEDDLILYDYQFTVKPLAA
jgi:hypothetical protein